MLIDGTWYLLIFGIICFCFYYLSDRYITMVTIKKPESRPINGFTDYIPICLVAVLGIVLISICLLGNINLVLKNVPTTKINTAEPVTVHRIENPEDITVEYDGKLYYLNIPKKDMEEIDE